MTTRRRLLTTRVGLGWSLDLACVAGLPPEHEGDAVAVVGGGHERDVEPGLDLVRSVPSLAFDRFHEFPASLRPPPHSWLGSVMYLMMIMMMMLMTTIMIMMPEMTIVIMVDNKPDATTQMI